MISSFLHKSLVCMGRKEIHHIFKFCSPQYRLHGGLLRKNLTLTFVEGNRAADCYPIYSVSNTWRSCNETNGWPKTKVCPLVDDCRMLPICSGYMTLSFFPIFSDTISYRELALSKVPVISEVTWSEQSSLRPLISCSKSTGQLKHRKLFSSHCGCLMFASFGGNMKWLEGVRFGSMNIDAGPLLEPIDFLNITTVIVPRP